MPSSETIIDEVAACVAVAGGGHMTELDVVDCLDLLGQAGELSYDVLTLATSLCLDGVTRSAMSASSQQRAAANIREFSSDVRRALILAAH